MHAGSRLWTSRERRSHGLRRASAELDRVVFAQTPLLLGPPARFARCYCSLLRGGAAPDGGAERAVLGCTAYAGQIGAAARGGSREREQLGVVGRVGHHGVGRAAGLVGAAER